MNNHDTQHPQGQVLLQAVQFAKVVHGSYPLVLTWIGYGLPVSSCSCRLIDPGVAIPWLQEKGWVDENGRARTWSHAHS